MIKKFEKKYNIKVTITDYDFERHGAGQGRAGGHGFDIVVPSANYVPIWINEGLLLETRPDQMENFKNVDRDGSTSRSTGPPLHGAVAVGHDRHRRQHEVYKGDINTSAIWLDPPAELKGKINVVPEMGDVMRWPIMYIGGEPCTGDKEMLKKVRDKLVGGQAELDVDGLRYHREDMPRRLSRPASTGTARPSAHGCRTRRSRLRLSQGRLRRSGWTTSPSSRTPRTSRTPSCSRTSSWTPRTPR